jgi:hypothetical protein
MKTAPKPPNSRTSHDADPEAHAPADAAEESWSSQISEVSDYVGHYFAARSDLWRTRSSKLVWNLATGVGAGVVGLSLAAVAASRLLAGIAGGLTVLLGGRAWAGDLLTGILVLASAGIGFTLIRKRAERERRRRLFAKYEQRHASQTERFGHDMSDRAAG